MKTMEITRKEKNYKHKCGMKKFFTSNTMCDLMIAKAMMCKQK